MIQEDVQKSIEEFFIKHAISDFEEREITHPKAKKLLHFIKEDLDK